MRDLGPAVWLVVAAIAWTARADEVERFLDAHGLRELLIVHVEQQLEAAAPGSRPDLIQRLARLYADALEEADNAGERIALEERSRRVLASAPEMSADELRLALLRGAYRSVEQIAERHRLRLATEDEVEQAGITLEEIVPKLQQLRSQLRDRIELTERRLSRAAGSDAVVLAEETERLRQLESQTKFLAAWALYYRAWLTGTRTFASTAETLFAELLGAEDGDLRPAEVSEDLRTVEAIARSILGMALCRSLTGASAAGEEWLALLEHEATSESIRAEVPVWRMVLHLEHGEFVAARADLERQIATSEQIPTGWLRVAAVFGLEADRTQRAASELAEFAVTHLAASGEVEQVLDLVSRYGAERLGESGFVGSYVRGLLAYDEARTAHGNDRPTSDADAIRLYRQALGLLRTALAQSDAGRFEFARAGCLELVAWCHYFQGEFIQARDVFDGAVDELVPSRAVEAAWMAIVCQDKLVQVSAEQSLHAELRRRIDAFLIRFPSSEYAPRLVLRRALMDRSAEAETVDRLLAIPENSDVYDQARRQAANVLYSLYRDARGSEQVARGRRYVDLALELLLRDDPSTAGAVVVLRRLLEVALDAGIDRVDAAQYGFRWLDTAEPEVTASWETELTFRRLQERLAVGAVDEAVRIGDELWNRDESSAWARLSARAMFQHVVRARWPGDTRDDEAAALVVRFGGRVLREFLGDEQALEDPDVLMYHAIVADASYHLWEETKDRERGGAALYLYRKLLEARPQNATFLRTAAILAEAVGEEEFALGCWRKLAIGSEAGSESWFEARYHIISVLARSDPAHAREVLDQFKLLQPDYGPPPWGDRIRRLDEEVPRSGET